MREAEVRTERMLHDEQDRARAEINAAYGAARAAMDGRTAEALEQAHAARDSADANWHSDWFVEPVISGCEIERLQNIVANEQGLLDLNLIPSSQLSLSKHNLDHAIELQSTQVSRAVASAAIAHAICDHYRARYPGLDLDEGAVCAAGPVQRVSLYARCKPASASM